MPRRVAKVAPAGWTYVRSALADLAEEGRRQDLSSSLAQLARTRQLPQSPTCESTQMCTIRYGTVPYTRYRSSYMYMYIYTSYTM